MTPIQIFRVREGVAGWEVSVMIGANESNGVGFLLKIEKEYWANLTGGVCSPERLTRITFEFLLLKEGSVFSIEREIDIREISKKFPDYEDQVRKKLVGAFGL